MAYESGRLWPYSAIRMVCVEDGRRSGQYVGGKKVVVMMIAEAAGIEREPQARLCQTYSIV